jgi:nitrite reductase/ring-hydroxylating ferredoxin subunit
MTAPGINPATTDPAAYTAGAQFQRERRSLFADSWLPFAASGQMPSPGDFVSHGFGGWPLFAIRGKDGVARGFHNVCRHQGMPVVEQPLGSCAALRCRYHGWTYAIDGEFSKAPPRATPPAAPAHSGLIGVALAEHDGLCLIRVRPGSDLPPRLGIPGRRFAAALTSDLDANWKAVVEALLAAPGWRFVWPVAFVCDPGSDRIVMRQIVPRSFSRTRLVDLVFAAADGVAADFAGEWQRRTALDKAAAEACQAKRAAAEETMRSPALGEFLARVAAACGAAAQL